MQTPDTACLRDFKKVQNMNQEKSFFVENSLEMARWIHKLNVAGSQEITRSGGTALIRLREMQIWCLSAGSIEEGSKGTMTSAKLLSGRKLLSIPPLKARLFSS